MRFCVFFLSILLALPLSAGSTDEETARETAARFLLETAGGRSSRASLQAEAANLKLADATKAAYLFTSADDRFVIAAADDRLPDILGYGTQGTGSQPEALKALMATYARSLQMGDFTTLATTEYDGPAVAPLLTFTRHQEAPYNNHCPYYTYADGTVSETRCVVGCVATALEEVISYYRRTVTLCDTLHGWSTDHYVIDDVLPGASVDTRLVRDDYNTEGSYTDEEADAVARLSYYLGVAVKMIWGVDSSGAYVHNVEEPLKRAFGFGYVHYVDSYKYTPADWFAMMRNEILSGRPVFYAGYAMRLNGHAFVLDGLDEDGLFHVNWGVNGDYDGYFRLDVLNAAEPCYDMTETGLTEGYFGNQQAVLIHPDALDVTLPDTLARTGLEVVVDSLSVDLTPENGKCTPVRLWVHNSADYAVTTPLVLFTNSADDDEIFADAYGVALTSVTLEPGEENVVKCYAVFSTGTDLILRVTPDEENIIYETTVTVEGQPVETMSFATPEVTFPEVGCVELHQTISNVGTAGRAGRKMTYEIFEGTVYDHNGTAHVDYCLLAPGETETDTVRFYGLVPEQDYTIYVRYAWVIRDSIHFVLPSATSIEGPVTTDETEQTKVWYDLSGRKVENPQQRGIYIVGRRKVYVP